MNNCINLEAIPADMNLASLDFVIMDGCPKLRNLPIISTHIRTLSITEAKIEDAPASINLCSRLMHLTVSYSGKFKGLIHLPATLTSLNLSYSDIERVPDCIKSLHQLEWLMLFGCRRLASLPELPSSIVHLYAEDCESLETVFCLLNTRCQVLNFRNCFKLGKQARGAIILHSIITRWAGAYLPGRKVPVEFNHRAIGNSLTIPLNGILLPRFTYFVVCVVVSPNQTMKDEGSIHCRVVKDYSVDIEFTLFPCISKCFQKEHLIICRNYWLSDSVFDSSIKSPQLSREIVLEFSSPDNDFNIIECGVEIWTKECYGSVTGERYESEPIEAYEDQASENNDDKWSYDEFQLSEASKDTLNSIIS